MINHQCPYPACAFLTLPLFSYVKAYRQRICPNFTMGRSRRPYHRIQTSDCSHASQRLLPTHSPPWMHHPHSPDPNNLPSLITRPSPIRNLFDILLRSHVPPHQHFDASTPTLSYDPSTPFHSPLHTKSKPRLSSLTQIPDTCPESNHWLKLLSQPFDSNS